MSDPRHDKLVEPWPLSLTRKRPLVSALIVMAVVFGAFLISGAAFGGVSPWADADPRVATGMALTYTALLGYFAGVSGYAANRVGELGRALGPQVTDEGRALIATLNRAPPRRLWVATAFGLLLGSLNAEWGCFSSFRRQSQLVRACELVARKHVGLGRCCAPGVFSGP